MSAPALSGLRINRPMIYLIFFFILAAPVISGAQPVKLSIKETMDKVQHNLPQLESYRQQVVAA